MKELKACVCGQKELLYHDKETNVICCPTCGVSGPWRDSDGSKWNAMNDRGEAEITNLLKALEQDRRDRIDRMVAAIISGWSGYVTWPYVPGHKTQFERALDLAMHQIAAIDKSHVDQEADKCSSSS